MSRTVLADSETFGTSPYAVVPEVLAELSALLAGVPATAAAAAR